MALGFIVGTCSDNDGPPSAGIPDHIIIEFAAMRINVESVLDNDFLLCPKSRPNDIVCGFANSRRYGDCKKCC
jgi:hypothetical protein